MIAQYKMTATEGPDALTVESDPASEWVYVSMDINGGAAGSRITLRSRRMAEQLHFMLGQMLRSAHPTKD